MMQAAASNLASNLAPSLSRRFEVERHLCRGLRYHPDSSELAINVVSGNLFSSQPRGVVNGVDYKYTGQVRRMQTSKIKSHLDSGEVVLLTNIGFSATSEIFNVSSLEVAVKCASELRAEKLILYSPEGEEAYTATDRTVREVRLSDARKILKECGNDPDEWPSPSEESQESTFWAAFEGGVRALDGGCQRAHLISAGQGCSHDGALLAELYTRDGVGLMISRDAYEEVRKVPFQRRFERRFERHF
jgi:amino-acid N-acetyltransferase